MGYRSLFASLHPTKTAFSLGMCCGKIHWLCALAKDIYSLATCLSDVITGSCSSGLLSYQIELPPH